MLFTLLIVGVPGLLILACWANGKFKLRHSLRALYYRWKLRRTQKAWETL